MPSKSRPQVDFQAELNRLADAAFLAAQRKMAEAQRKKIEAKKAQHRARHLRAMVNALSAKPADGENGSYGYHHSHFEHDEWPWRVALIKRRMGVSDYARKQVNPPLGVQTAKHWLKVGAAKPRPIPEFWAEKIAKDFTDDKGRSEVPAVDASWPHGIKRG